MSCDVAVAAVMMFTSAHQTAPAQLFQAVAVAPPSVSSEPLFKDIVSRADTLKAEVEVFRKAVAGADHPMPLPGFDAFGAQIGQLAVLDEQGHKLLLARGAPDDLKCILHGISQDLSVKLTAVTAAKTGKDEELALRDMSFLLRDNVEVITAPPRPAA
jgi:hypothetical protein